MASTITRLPPGRLGIGHDLQAGIELLEPPVAGAPLLIRVEAPALTLLQDEVGGEFAILENAQHQLGDVRQRQAVLRNDDGFVQRERLFAGCAAIENSVADVLVKVLREGDAIFFRNCRK